MLAFVNVGLRAKYCNTFVTQFVPSQVGHVTWALNRWVFIAAGVVVSRHKRLFGGKAPEVEMLHSKCWHGAIEVLADLRHALCNNLVGQVIKKWASCRWQIILVEMLMNGCSVSKKFWIVWPTIWHKNVIFHIDPLYKWSVHTQHSVHTEAYSVIFLP